MSEFRRRLLIPQEKYNEITCYYSISTNGSYRIFGGDISQVEKMWVDGEEITPANTYALAQGEHKVVIRFSNLTTCYDFLYNCTTVTRVELKKLDTSLVANFNSMFARCPKLQSLNISDLDFSKGTNFSTINGSVPAPKDSYAVMISSSE